MIKDNLDNTDVKLTRGLVFLMALTSGLTIASTIYSSPLLDLMASDFGISRNNIGLVPTFTQIGYGCGMLFLVPRGDIRERKSLIINTLALSVLALLMVRFSMNFTWLLLASFFVGFSSIITQLLVPFAALLAEPHKRGRIIGNIISGLITGIIGARFVSGFVGARFGWRVMYTIAPILIAILALTLNRFLPKSYPKSKESYGDIIKSMLGILKDNPVVRSSSIIGPFIFASFQLFWTSIVFLLESPAFNVTRSTSEIAGRFSLVGIVGVFLVPLMGTLSDKKSPRFAIGVSVLLAFSSYIVLGVFGSTIIGLTIGIMILDFAVNSSQVSNQARINSVESPRQSRFNSVFMSIYFFIGSLGSFLGSYTFNSFGWIGVLTTGFIFVSISLVAHLTIGRKGYDPNRQY